MIEQNDALQQIENVSVWKQGTQRAPHKPLLLLMALAAVQRGEERQLPFDQIDDKLRSLLVEYGPQRKSYHPEYPFWRLQNDGDFWEIPQRDALEEARGDRLRTGDIPVSILRDHRASGGFSEPVYEYLTDNPQAVNEITAKILQKNFPPSMHEDLLDAVGMPWLQVMTGRQGRDPGFRDAIVRIYEHRCAVCGFDGKLGMSDLALEAAHVMWHAAGGPDREENGVALCVLHHRLLDRGAIGISDDYRILVSQSVHGGAQVTNSVTQFAGRELQKPQAGTPRIGDRYINWHSSEVFRGPARNSTP